MPRVVHFEIPADDTKRAVEFYKSVFGWQITGWEGMDYHIAVTGTDGVGIDGAIMDRTGTAKTVATTIEVASLEEFIEKVKQAGGTRLTDPSEIPGVGNFCYCRDTEGNVFGLLEPVPRG